jgi:hypothetical protein
MEGKMFSLKLKTPVDGTMLFLDDEPTYSDDGTRGYLMVLQGNEKEHFSDRTYCNTQYK